MTDAKMTSMNYASIEAKKQKLANKPDRLFALATSTLIRDLNASFSPNRNTSEQRLTYKSTAIKI